MKNGFGKTEAYGEREKAFYIGFAELKVLYSTLSLPLFIWFSNIRQKKAVTTLVDNDGLSAPVNKLTNL